MIHEVDEGLRLLLASRGIPGDGVDLVFEAPTKDWAARRNTPTVNVFLYDLREDFSRRQTGMFRQLDDTGEVVSWRSPPHWYRLSYLVTAWTSRAQDEHRLLSDVLRCLAAQDALTGRLLTGSLAELGMAVNFRSAAPIGEERAASELFTALGGLLKPAVNVEVVAPLAGEDEPAAPPVTDGVLLHASRTDQLDELSVGGAERRRLRYIEGEDAEEDGFAGPRHRPEIGSRRRWGPRP